MCNIKYEKSPICVINQTEIDALTGLYKRTTFLQKTRQMLTEHSNGKYLFFRFDIDRFQMINFLHGYEEGDRLLQHISVNINSMCIDYSRYTIARVNDDVFSCCIAYDDLNDIMAAIEKLYTDIKNYSREYEISMSFGFYLIDDKEIPIHEMLDKTNLAAKTCKGNYNKKFAFYTDKMTHMLSKEQEIINEIQLALAQEEFQIYIQPKFNLQTGQAEGGEALVRWAHPKKGLMLPSEFVPTLEKCGLISELDFYVLERVCMLLKKWVMVGVDNFPISVNLSRVDFCDSNIALRIVDLANRYEIETSLLHIELTESAFADNINIINESIKILRNHGFTLMMDDFGSGYSSLNVLNEIDIDVLKIDMRFFKKSILDEKSAMIVISILEMSKRLKLSVIAEGIESKEQLEFLKRNQCDYAQGYYFSRPLPIVVFEHKYIVAQTILEQEEVRYIAKQNV